jgi:uncharacterized protein (DUF433 family)
VTIESQIDTSVLRPVVRGTRIKVAQIAREFEAHGLSPNEIAEVHPHLTLGQVQAALVYFRANEDAIRADWAQADRRVDAIRAEFPPLR